MMMELLGPSLDSLFDICKRTFSLKTILSLGDQMLCRIEFLHSMNLIHRDIKPDNFLMGLNDNKSIVYICDFGLCKMFVDQNGKHIPFKEGKTLTGTSRYASINSHLGYEQSRRDDLESLAYSLIYFSRGSLPWMGIKAQNKEEKYKKIFQIKLNSSVDVLCDKLPKEFIEFVNYIKNLAFDEKPDYQYLKSILGNIYENHNYSYDTIYDFTDYLTKKEKENKEKEKKSKINLSPSVGNDKEESSKKIEQNFGETNNIINY
jgi:serine/threonine protein kinase